MAKGLSIDDNLQEAPGIVPGKYRLQKLRATTELSSKAKDKHDSTAKFNLDNADKEITARTTTIARLTLNTPKEHSQKGTPTKNQSRDIA